MGVEAANQAAAAVQGAMRWRKGLESEVQGNWCRKGHEEQLSEKGEGLAMASRGEVEREKQGRLLQQ